MLQKIKDKIISSLYKVLVQYHKKEHIRKVNLLNLKKRGSIYDRKKILQEAISQFGSETFRKRMLAIYNKNININGY